MGFLKRLFSIGTKNGKKERKQYDRPSLPPAILECPVTSEEDAERVCTPYSQHQIIMLNNARIGFEPPLEVIV
jgi:hypothetical protein